MRTWRVLLEWKYHHGLESDVVCARDVLTQRGTRTKFRFEITYRSVIKMPQESMPDETGVVAPQHLDIAAIGPRMLRRPRKIDMDIGVVSINVVQKYLQIASAEIIKIYGSVINNQINCRRCTQIAPRCPIHRGQSAHRGTSRCRLFEFQQ